MIKALTIITLSLLSLEICPTYHTPSPVVRERIESTCTARWLERVARREQAAVARAHTVVLAGSGPATETPMAIRVKRRVGV